MVQERKTAARSSKGKGGHDSTYETRDQVVAGALLMDGLPLLNAERRENAIVFIFRARAGLDRQVREIEKIAGECAAAQREIEARIAAALSS